MKSGYVYINNNIFDTLLAISAEEQSTGLMWQKWPPPTMSFVYGAPQVNRFWMKNTPSPLDIIFCYEGKVKEICVGEPYSTQIIGGVLSDLVIEFPRGTIDQAQIKINDDVGLFNPKIGEIIKKRF